jgi:hypothetical protein
VNGSLRCSTTERKPTVPDIESLRELSPQIHRPGFDDLVVVSRQRRRRTALVAAAGATVVVLGLGATAVGLSDGGRAQDPVQQPSPSEVEPSRPETQTTGDWPLDRIRAEGTPMGAPFDSRLGPAPGALLDAELYCVGEEGCDDWPPDLEGSTSHFALEITEMTENGRSALFEVRGRPFAKYFDEDSVLVLDGIDGEERYRLLQADGTELTLRVLDDPVPAGPGPEVVLVQALQDARNFQFGPEGSGFEPYVVDDRAGTLQPMDVPREVEWWGPNTDELIWGGDDCQVIWQRPDGEFERHDLDCQEDQIGTTDPGWNWPRFDGWLEPGRMAVVEWSENGPPLAVHASLDLGATWDRIQIEDRAWGDSLVEIADALEDALSELD